MSTLVLRDYQVEGVQETEAAWARGVQRPAVVFATGLGKTAVTAEIISRWIARHRFTPQARVLFLAHREELLDQAAAEIRMLTPDLRVGIVQADRDNVTADVVIGSVLTLKNERRRHRIVHVGLVVVDECHHAVAQSYVDIMRHYGCYNEHGARAFGVTATMTRSDSKALGQVWQEVVCVKGIEFGVDNGWLLPPKGKWVYVPDLDLSKVKKSGGDYAKGALGAALEGSLAPRLIAEAYREHCADRQGILFAPTVHCAQVYGEELNTQGFKTVMVDGKTDKGERRAAFEAIRRGDAQILANCGVATEGTNLPMVSAIVSKPTKSDGLHTQMIGRGLRTWPGQTDCIVLYPSGKKPGTLRTQVELFGEERFDVDEAGISTEIFDDEQIRLFDEDQVIVPEAKSAPELPEFVDGQLVTVEIDLFRGSKSTWCRTYGGTWFLPAGDRLIVIKPAPNGLWDVVWCHKFTKVSGVIQQDVTDMGYAMGFAEGNMTPEEKRFATRQASKSVRIGPGERREAQRYGIVVRDGMRLGELAHEINLAIGSQRIDPYLSRR